MNDDDPSVSPNSANQQDPQIIIGVPEGNGWVTLADGNSGPDYTISASGGSISYNPSTIYRTHGGGLPLEAEGATAPHSSDNVCPNDSGTHEPASTAPLVTFRYEDDSEIGLHLCHLCSGIFWERL